MNNFNDDSIKNNLEWVSNLSIDIEPDAVRKSSIICTIGNIHLRRTYDYFLHACFVLLLKDRPPLYLYAKNLCMYTLH